MNIFIPRVVIRRPLQAVLFCMALLSSQSYATVRLTFLDSAIVNDTLIRLGDITAVSGDADCQLIEILKRMPVGEAAPAGYSRFVNTDEIDRYALRAAGIDCFATKMPDKRISIRTDFQERKVGEYAAQIAACMSDRVGWTKEEYCLKILNVDDKWRCLKAPFSVNVEGPALKYPKGKFSCKLQIKQGKRKIIIPVHCLMTVEVPVVVSTLKIKRKEQLTAENCAIEKRNISLFKYTPFKTIAELQNTLISRTINAGTIIYDKITEKIPDVQRNDQVKLYAIAGKIKVCIIAIARESGSIGDKIFVENEKTHKLIKAKIIDHGKAVIMNGDRKI